MAPNPWCLGYALFCFVLLGLTHVPTTLLLCHRFKNTHQITTISGASLLLASPIGKSNMLGSAPEYILTYRVS
ncbi:hypothetical protein EDB82DRAFT_506058 [Fusarium venenatum]|uniref:uncharacterized protein n=1 Tax=Fusarium venenatum TaxID=56646 RepID=UPI001DAA0A0F|nr:hypothetical protein EDB82DRAFT_506058 [Fusarium venenatum]